ncbi:hypothetical protein WA1_49755 [Scytonema hofmannii PCC 7110]|uniref:Uncharacterized protein n=1 Tax=Scytonema hofmannii PCC 7110 TaxID=128403 RepID=A0A139WQW6_9CYAN|nr:hypothetical protein WA1_49755 [Scytonema hofmannii PCC 7110]
MGWIKAKAAMLKAIRWGFKPAPLLLTTKSKMRGGGLRPLAPKSRAAMLWVSGKSDKSLLPSALCLLPFLLKPCRWATE